MEKIMQEEERKVVVKKQWKYNRKEDSYMATSY